MRGSCPSFPKAQCFLFPQNNPLTLSRSRDELAKPISRCLSWQIQAQNYLAWRSGILFGTFSFSGTVLTYWRLPPSRQYFC